MLCSGTTCFFLFLVEASSTIRVPNVGWRTIWTTRVLLGHVSVFPGIEVDILNSPVFCRLQSATGQCCFCVVSGHGGTRRHPAPSCVQTSQRRNASILSAQRAGVGKESNTLSAEIGDCPYPNLGLKALTQKHKMPPKSGVTRKNTHFSYSGPLIIVVLW